MKKVTKLAIALLVLFQAARADIPLTLSEVYEDSMLWSAYLTLQDSVAVEGGELKQGTRGVLIRLELTASGVEALLDFGRHGIHKVPAKRTDLLARAEALQRGHATKQQPNLTGLLYSRMIKIEDGKARRFTATDAADVERFICIRMMDSPRAWEVLSEEFERLAVADRQGRYERVLFLDGDERLTDEVVLSKVNDAGLSNLSYLYSFLSQDYMKILWTGLVETDDVLHVLEFDVNGRLLSQKHITE